MHQKKIIQNSKSISCQNPVSCHNDVARKSKGCFNEVSKMFHASFKNMKYQEWFKKVSGVKCFEKVLRVFQDSSKKF